MLAPKARGELSEELIGALRSGTASWDEVANGVPTDADDLHLSLWTMYELSYRGFDDVDDDLEWHPAVLTLRYSLERRFEAELRAAYPPPPLTGPFAEASPS